MNRIRKKEKGSGIYYRQTLFLFYFGTIIAKISMEDKKNKRR